MLRRLAIACVATSLDVAAPAWGHGGPSGHLLQAAQRNGHPIKVALVSGEDDVAGRPELLRDPQRHAERLVAGLEAVRPVTAPLLSRAGGAGGSTPGWISLAVFAAVFLLAWLGCELRIRAPRRRRPVVT